MEQDGVLRIDCDDCAMVGTSTCDDCLVTFLCGRGSDGSVVVDISEARAIRLLQRGGLAPVLRHQPRAAGAPT